jgi:eukaryotic-like serine/threonine-protein kinase
MRAPLRSHPTIPDHDVLRKIGGGAYGEVWMARGVTGALRAVKVVWREDFDDEKTFEREFEGILKYEPISRDHPALVNVLHVGRSPDSRSFYYYVMELGDDMNAGQDINPIEYEARTLRADGKKSVRWDTSVCIDVGIRLAEALDHLHQKGLAHRDVKPSNVIFVNGKAKLADIGLVAARDQRTFVGTEGFVPPEGPGSAQADIYSLGKVLYEIATGKDRLDFPELPDELPTGLERKRWLELNKIICDVCDPRINKRHITSAGELVEALLCIQRGTSRHRRGFSIWATSAILFGFAGWTAWSALKDSEWLPWNKPMTMKPVVAERLIRIVTLPDGADVFSEDGAWVGSTPTTIGTLRAEVGKKIEYNIKKNGFKDISIVEEVRPGLISDPVIIYHKLENFTPPIKGEIWRDHRGLTYLPVEDKHLSSLYISRDIWKDFLKPSGRLSNSVEFIDVSQNGKNSTVVLAQQPDIIAFIDWMRVSGIKQGFFTQDHEITAEVDQNFMPQNLSERAKRENLKPFKLLIGKYKYGAVQLVSEPPGAEVYLNGVHSGNTSGTLLIPKVKPGPVELLIILEGYKPFTMNAYVNELQELPLSATLQPSKGVVFGKTWNNGIDMRFEPMGLSLMVSAFETRVMDYEVFIKNKKCERPPKPEFKQTPHHPVVNVTRDNALAFCEWLTEKERQEELIGQTHLYRLPTDLEWSWFAGLEREVGDGPSQRDVNKSIFYEWGAYWPPPEEFGNYADISAAGVAGIAPSDIIGGYNDNFARTSPVGKFASNKFNIYDLSGNVHEWVKDDILLGKATPLGVLRGGGWNSYRDENLQLGWRNPVPPTAMTDYYGFRIVLSKSDPVEEPAILNE